MTPKFISRLERKLTFAQIKEKIKESNLKPTNNNERERSQTPIVKRNTKHQNITPMNMYTSSPMPPELLDTDIPTIRRPKPKKSD
jgi:hypothetical protein